jgi:hypothetical protein
MYSKVFHENTNPAHAITMRRIRRHDEPLPQRSAGLDYDA